MCSVSRRRLPYLKGFLSYPRTETSRYPEAFDLRGTVECLAAAPEWRTAARTLLQTRPDCDACRLAPQGT